MEILIALGGNAILQENERGTYEEQYSNIRRTAKKIAEIINMGNNVVVTHGNGPQVGDIVSMYEWAKDRLPAMPLAVCGAESQGMIGYMIAQALGNELRAAGTSKEVVCMLTRTVVDAEDSNFKKPSKPIGPFYEKDESENIEKKYGWTMAKENGKYRRVVASPKPIDIIEFVVIKRLFASGTVVVCAGGGGVPVVIDGTAYKDASAVIDKDLASSLLARKLGVDLFIILTDVANAFLGYGTKGQKPIGSVTIKECENYAKDGEFQEGSMKPKIEAALEFVKETGKPAVITSLDNAKKAVELKAGTIIRP
ncbi:MAG: carbamate kinase [Candidatus Micrarchaeaceae archaeon]